RSAVVDRNIVDEARAKVEIGEQVVVAGEINSVMAGASKHGIERAGRFENNILDGAEIAAGKDATVGVRDDQIARPAIGDSGKRNGIETHFLEMAEIGRVGEFEAKVLHAGLGQSGREFADARLPFELHVAAERTVEVDCIARDSGNANNQGDDGAAQEIGGVARVAGV